MSEEEARLKLWELVYRNRSNAQIARELGKTRMQIIVAIDHLMTEVGARSRTDLKLKWGQGCRS